MKIKRFICDNAAVVNLDECEKFFRDVLGAKMGPEMPHAERFGFRAKGVWMGTEQPYRLELMQATTEDAPFGRAVKKAAPRIMTISFEVDSVDDAIKELRAKGIKVSDKMDLTPLGFDKLGFEGVYECMIHPSSACGLTIELLEFKKIPPPGKW